MKDEVSPAVSRGACTRVPSWRCSCAGNLLCLASLVQPLRCISSELNVKEPNLCSGTDAMDVQSNVENQDGEFEGNFANRQQKGTSELPTWSEEAHSSKSEVMPPPPDKVQQSLNIEDAAGGGNASGAPLQDNLAPQDDLQSLLDGPHPAGTAGGRLSAQDAAKALRRRYRELTQERRREKQRKRRECFKESVVHLRKMVPGLNKKSDPVEVFERAAQWITHVNKYITQAKNAAQAAHGPPHQLG